MDDRRAAITRLEARRFVLAACKTSGPRSRPTGHRLEPGYARQPRVGESQEASKVPIASLWIPILLSAVAVFIASSIIHMVLPYHRADYKKLPAEDDIIDALRRFAIPSGDYVFPRPSSPKAMKDPSFLEKMKKGPAGLMTIKGTASPATGKSLALWFLYCAVVGVFAAYVAGRALPAGAPYRAVFRFAGVTAFACYALGLWQNTIWLWRSAATTLKSTFDGLVYALLTGGIFGWLWPR